MTEEELAAREAAIMGMAPRIGPIAPDELDDSAMDVAARIRSTGSGKPMASKAEIPEYVRTMLRHADLLEAYTGFAVQITARARIPARDRELVVLRVGWRLRAPYEFGEHVRLGKQRGVSDAEIERVIAGPGAAGWSAHDRALLRAVDELLDDAMIGDATWATLSETFDTQQMIELPMLIGNYQATAYLQNSLRMRMMPGNIGLRAR